VIAAVRSAEIEAELVRLADELEDAINRRAAGETRRIVMDVHGAIRELYAIDNLSCNHDPIHEVRRRFVDEARGAMLATSCRADTMRNARALRSHLRQFARIEVVA